MADDFLSKLSDYTGGLVDRVAEMPKQAGEKATDMLKDFQAYLKNSKDAPEGTKVYANIRDWAASLPDKGQKYGKEAVDAVAGFWEEKMPDDLKPKKGGFLDNNKGALGGVAMLGILGMLLTGNVIGALIFAIIGFLGGSLMDGKGGLLGNLLFGGEDKPQTPGGTTPAPDGPAAAKQNEIMLGAQGQVVSKAEDAKVVLKGKFTGEAGKEQFQVENAMLRGDDGNMRALDLGKNPLVLNAKNASEIASQGNLKIVEERLVQAVDAASASPATGTPAVQTPTLAPQQPATPQTAAPTQQPTSQPSAAPATTTPTEPPAAAATISSGTSGEAIGPVIAPMTGVAGAAVAFNPADPLGLGLKPAMDIPQYLRAPQAVKESGVASYDIKTADGDVARSATFGITKSGRFVDLSNADVLIAGVNNMDGTFTLTGVAARNEKGEFPKISPKSDEPFLVSILGKSKEQLTVPAPDNKLNADEPKTKMALLVTASDEIARQGTLNAKATEEANKRLAATTEEALKKQVALVNKDKAATLVRSEGDILTFVQSGMLNNGDRYNFKFQGRFETVAAENGIGTTTQRLIVDRGNFVDSPDAPIGSQSLIDKNKPYVMSMTTLGEDGKTLVGDSRNLSFMRDDTSPTKLSVDYLTSLNAMSSKASAAPTTPALAQATTKEAAR